MRQLKGLRYYGGKSPVGSKARWICSIMGFNKRESYIEPFAGMLGVLLSRPKSRVEMVNDANGDLVNWWKCVRDFPDEMAHRVALTPRSRKVFSESIQILKSEGYEDDPMGRAVAFHCVCCQSMSHSSIGQTPGRWALSINPNVGSLGNWSGEEFAPLASRMRDVQIENRCASEVLERTSREPGCLIYCDPPYRTADASPYGDFELSWSRLGELLLAQKGNVAISGYGDEWDCLGWTRSELKSAHTPIGANASAPGAKASKRVEVLWTNFEPAQRRLFPV